MKSKIGSILVLLVILCICSFAFPDIGDEGRTVNLRRVSSGNVAFPDNAACSLVGPEFGGGTPESARSESVACRPLEESKDEIGPDNRVKGSSSLTALQRLFYELVAAAVARYAVTTLSNSATSHQHVPKHIKKRLPGLKRKRWREMSLSFSRNALLLHIFYGSHRKHCSIADFIGLICHSLRVTTTVFVRCSIALSIFWARYAIALSLFWVRYTVFCTRHNLRCFCHRKKTQFRCMISELQLFVLLTRTISFSFALEVLFELRRQRFHSSKSPNILYNRILRSVIICIRPIFIGSDGFKCNYLSLLNVAATIVALAVRSMHRQFPTFRNAQKYVLELCTPADACHRVKTKRSMSPPTTRLRQKSSNSSTLLRLSIVLSFPALVTVPNDVAVATDLVGSDGSNRYGYFLNIAVIIIAIAAVIIIAITAGCMLYWRFPTLEQAQDHMKTMCCHTNGSCGVENECSVSPPSPARLHRNSSRLTTLLRLFIFLSLPTLVTAPGTTGGGAAAAASFQTAPAAVIGSGVAASVVYYANRTRKWTAKERELKELCMSCGVEYVPPPLREHKDERAVRRKSMVDACQGVKKERRRLKDEEALRKLCLEKGVTYIPPPPNETRREQENRRRNLRSSCNEEDERLNRALMMKKRRKNESPQEKEAEATRKREARANETTEGKKRRLDGNAARNREARANETTERKRKRLDGNAKQMQEAREAKRKAEDDVYHEEDKLINDEIPDIEVCLEGAKEARNYLLRTDDGSGQHKALGCTVCDEFIIGTEERCYVPKDRILQHRDRLGVRRYQQEYFGGQAMDEELKKQYEIKGMEGILLSRRFGKDDANEFPVCSSCRESLRNDNIDKSPPKKSIANGFLIGSIPKVITYENKDGVEENMSTVIETFDADGNPVQNHTVSKVTSILAAALSPVRPYAFIFSYRGGRHQSLVGNFQFFDTDQSKVAGALQCLHKSGVDANIYVVLNGRMTPTQKQIVRRKAELDRELYFGLLRWFKKHHPAFKEVDVGDDEENSELKVALIEDRDIQANRDEPGNPDKENKEEGATFHFSSAGEPTTDTSVYRTTKDLVLALLKNHSAPTLSIHGGNYSAHSDVMHLENVFPTVFPFGSGGPTLKRSSAISKEEVIRHYLRLSLPQFMESEFILVANYLLGRILSYESAKIKCRPKLDEDGTAVGDEIGKMTIEEIQAAAEDEHHKNNGNGVKGRAKMFLKAVSASCRQLGMSEEAAKSARRKCFALQEYYGMHSLFVTITIDDECSFRVRLYPSVDSNGNGVSVPSSASLLRVCVSHDLIHRFSIVLLPTPDTSSTNRWV